MAKPRNLFEWKTRTDDGGKRQVRAQLFGSKWTISSRLDSEETWTAHASPSLEDLEDLERVLFNKYQRKHTAWEHVVRVRKQIEDRAPRERPSE